MPVLLSAAILIAVAQSGGDNAARTVDDLFACRAITTDAERLACYDRTAAAMSSARDSKQIVIVDQAQMKKTKRSLFGFALPRINLFGGKDEDDTPELKEVDGVVASASRYGTGLWQVRLEDGSTWQFTESMFVEPRAGDPIHIRSAAFGSYMGAVRGKTGARVKRVK